MSKYKKFWIENGSHIYGCTDVKENLNGWKANGEGPWEVIERKALDEALKYLKDIKRVLNNDLEIQPNSALHRCIEGFLKGLGEG